MLLDTTKVYLSMHLVGMEISCRLWTDGRDLGEFPASGEGMGGGFPWSGPFFHLAGFTFFVLKKRAICQEFRRMVGWQSGYPQAKGGLSLLAVDRHAEAGGHPHPMAPPAGLSVALDLADVRF